MVLDYNIRKNETPIWCLEYADGATNEIHLVILIYRINAIN